MNIIVIPDAAMIVIPLIEKNGHTYLSPSNFSKYDNMDICEGNLSYDKILSQYLSSELPSGVRGRLHLFSKIIDDAQAAIIIDKRPQKRERMYNALNELILFGGNSCNNAHSLYVKMVDDLNIPILKLDYPTCKSEIIDLINKTNHFLRNLDENTVTANDLIISEKHYPLFEVEKILKNIK